MNEDGCNDVPLIEKIEYEKPLEKFINIKELTDLGALEIEKGNFQEFNYVVNFESYFGKKICYWNHVLTWAS